MKYGVLTAVALATTAALGHVDASAAVDAGPSLELRRVLLSTGGVGYFEYEATLQGAADLPLSVRRDQVDDVLKSLVVYDDAGNLGEVSLPGKELTSDAFRDLPITQAALDSTAALLLALRGADVRVESAGSVITGRIVSVTEEQKKSTSGEMTTQHRLSLFSEGALRQVVVEQIDSLKVLDPALQKQLDAALDALSAQRERDRREIRIHIDGTGERTVRVGYVAEVPLWKSTYRLLLPPTTSDKTAALTGFAVVENRSGEAWKNVDLTLVSGNPVTFRQAIYDTYYVTRPTVPVEVLGRVLPRVDEGGMQLVHDDQAMKEASDEAEMGNAGPTFAPSFDSAPGFGGFGRGRFFAGDTKSAASPAPDMAPITSALGSEQATQVLFHLPAPVSLESGATALLPVISLALPTERVSLYQPATAARHPLSSVLITNNSATDLPPGVVAIYERAAESGETAYAGDAQLALLPAGQTRFVSYAVDLRVTVDRENKNDQTISVASIAEGTLKITRIERKKTIYTVAGAAGEPRTVILEHPRIAGFELVPSDDYQVMEVTQSAYRLRREIPADQTVKLTVSLERPLVETIALADIGSDLLAVYADSADLPVKVREALHHIVALRAVVAAKETTLSQLTAERAKIYDDQTRLRENLKAVPAGSDLAKKYLTRLSDQEERLSALDGEITAAESAAQAARDALAAVIKDLQA